MRHDIPPSKRCKRCDGYGNQPGDMMREGACGRCDGKRVEPSPQELKEKLERAREISIKAQKELEEEKSVWDSFRPKEDD